jgi:sulfite exporter TauE/SafE
MSSINPLLFVYLSTGLAVGFGHCIGMCGPLVVSLSLSLKDRNLIVSHLLYNCGRILTYMVLGGIMGATGAFTVVAAHIEVLQKGVMFLAGALVLFMGVAMAGWLPLGKTFGYNCRSEGFVTRGFARLSSARSPIVYLPIGLLLGLLPCGPVYTALLGVARGGMEAETLSHGILSGMGLMAAFGLGTIPPLLLVATLSNIGWLKMRDRIYRAGAILMIGVGAYFMISAVRY